MKRNLTPVYIRHKTSNGSNVDNSNLSFDEKWVKLMHHPDRSKDVDIEHFLDHIGVGIDGGHRIAFRCE